MLSNFCCGRTGETSPRLDSECPAENASGRLTSYLTSTDIKMELLDETARIISTGATACTAERDRAADRLRLPSVAERRLRPPTVQGTQTSFNVDSSYNNL